MLKYEIIFFLSCLLQIVGIPIFIFGFFILKMNFNVAIACIIFGIFSPFFGALGRATSKGL